MSQPKDLLRLSDAEKRAALETLERRAMTESGRMSRMAPRHKLVDHERIIVELGQSDATLRALVIPRDVSEGGVSFLHGVFVYSGTTCVTLLRTRDNETMLVPGKVVRCTHVAGRVHEVGVKFDHPIDVAPFLASHEKNTNAPVPVDAWPAIAGQLEQLGAAVRSQDGPALKRILDAMQSAAADTHSKVA